MKNTLSVHQLDELHRLAATAIDGTITSTDFARLCELLHADPAARNFYVQYLDLHATLARRLAGEKGALAREMAAVRAGQVSASREFPPVAMLQQPGSRSR